MSDLMVICQIDDVARFSWLEAATPAAKNAASRIESISILRECPGPSFACCSSLAEAGSEMSPGNAPKAVTARTLPAKRALADLDGAEQTAPVANLELDGGTGFRNVP